MVFFGPFREEAAASRSERQQLDHLLLITAPRERIMLVITGLLLVAFILWVLLGSIVRSITLEGIVVGDGSRQEIVVLEPGYLVEYRVAVGDRVAAGDVIAQQTVPELDHEISLLRNQFELLTTPLETSGAQEDLEHPLVDATRVTLLQLEAQRSARSQLISHSDGEVMVLLADPGDYLPAGTAITQISSGENLARRAVLHVTSKQANRLRSGMPAAVEIFTRDGTKHHRKGEIEYLTAGPLPRWLATLLQVPAEYGHLVSIKLPETSNLTVPDGTPGRVHIEIGRTTPLDFLISGRR